MDFLKAIFGDKALTYDELVQALNSHNGNEVNKDNQVKLANIAAGEYVGKGKYDSLQTLYEASKADVQNLTATIESLKKGKVDAETLQQKVADAEKLLAESKTRETELKVKYALDVAMLAEGVKKENAELLAIALERKLKEKGEALELDENDNIKGWSDKLTGLKTQYPQMFEGGESGNAGGYVPVDNKGLPKPNSDKTVTKEQFMKMSVDERIALKQRDEKMYKSLKG